MSASQQGIKTFWYFAEPHWILYMTFVPQVLWKVKQITQMKILSFSFEK